MASGQAADGYSRRLRFGGDSQLGVASFWDFVREDGVGEEKAKFYVDMAKKRRNTMRASR